MSSVYGPTLQRIRPSTDEALSGGLEAESKHPEYNNPMSVLRVASVIRHFACTLNARNGRRCQGVSCALTRPALLDFGMSMMTGRARSVVWLKPHQSQCSAGCLLQFGRHLNVTRLPKLPSSVRLQG
jgi:hypothetical protein